MQRLRKICRRPRIRRLRKVCCRWPGIWRLRKVCRRPMMQQLRKVCRRPGIRRLREDMPTAVDAAAQEGMAQEKQRRSLRRRGRQLGRRRKRPLAVREMRERIMHFRIPEAAIITYIRMRPDRTEAVIRMPISVMAPICIRARLVTENPAGYQNPTGYQNSVGYQNGPSYGNQNANTYQNPNFFQQGGNGAPNNTYTNADVYGNGKRLWPSKWAKRLSVWRSLSGKSLSGSADCSYQPGGPEPPMKVSDWVLTLFVLAIPCVNIIMLLYGALARRKP